MNWLEVCEDKRLQNLPYKIELNRWGKIEMSPHRREHSLFQGEIAYLLRNLLPHGVALSECAIETTENVKVADVAWASRQRWQSMADRVTCSVAPEICVEILSAANTPEEMNGKRALYFHAGAVESWLCDESGNVRCFNQGGELTSSNLCPAFPHRIEV
jgi:Uma2 family endonuclease